MTIAYGTGNHTFEVFREDGEREEFEAGAFEFVGEWLVFDLGAPHGRGSEWEAIPARLVTRVRIQSRRP